MRRGALIVGVLLAALILGAVVRNQLKVSRNREIRRQTRAAEASVRGALYDLLRPVTLSNCRLERFGEANDGGYLMCGNLLGAVQAAYSYGIAGYDKWGCDISTTLHVRVHQYDCFDPTRPACPHGDTVFHDECVAAAPRTEDGRLFDTIANHLAKNGDQGKPIVMKIDVEGAEWDAFLQSPPDVLDRIEQLAVEFHEVPYDKALEVVRRLKERFHVAHIHFNNAACVEGLEPFPTAAYEVLFVNKRVGLVAPSAGPGGPHPLDAPNNPSLPDCQPQGH